MGFIRNFEIWTNQRPRVCNYDIMDYIERGVIGNSCTENTTPMADIDWEDSQTTANATHDAWLRAVDEYFLSALAFFYQSDYQNSQGHPDHIPGQDNFRCITPENYNKIIDLIYGPDGFWEKSFDFDVARLLWWNCLLNPGSSNKRTGTYSGTFRRPTGKYTYIDKPFTVDFANYQTPSYEKYLEFRSKMDPMLASLKIIMQTAFKHPLTDYEIGPEPCPDIIIGTQIWKRCNLRVDKYRNGDPIPEVQDPIEWAALTTGAWCYYNNDPKTENVYGKMYNWYAVNDPRGLAPVGYHIPTDAEWGLLVDYVGGSDLAGGVLKEKGSVNPNFDPLNSAGYYCTSWDVPSSSSNEREFTATASGYRLADGDFYREHKDAFWWTQTLYDIDSAVNYNMSYVSDQVGRDRGLFGAGLAVRVLKGETPVECPDVTIGTQTWTRCNLTTTTYRNGDVIPQVTDPTEWYNLTTGAWCYYDNDPSTEAIYGKLYNWYALNDPRGIAPEGYHVPSNYEWDTLINFLGGSLVAGGKMKRAGVRLMSQQLTGKWSAPNTDATNSSLFTAIPSGYRAPGGGSSDQDEFAHFWSLDSIDLSHAYEYVLHYTSGEIINQSINKQGGLSVRLLKGETPQVPVCKEIKIGTQTWTGCNLDVTTYRNGDVIPYVEDPTEWASLTTGAWCYYEDGSINNRTYGKLYNWYAVNDPRGLAPEGWHVPTQNEWDILINHVGGPAFPYDYAGGKLKEAGFNHWNSPNTDATNEFCFTALPGGHRYDDGSYYGINLYGNWWTATEIDATYAWSHVMFNNFAKDFKGPGNKKHAFSVRLVKDITCGDDIVIGTQTWAFCNTSLDTYKNGDPIPHITDATEWKYTFQNKIGAWCYYNNDPSTEVAYGKIYNAYVLDDPRGFGPDGYHVPTDEEFIVLTQYLGGNFPSGGKLKEAGFNHWLSPNTNATNESNFTALPAGERTSNGNFESIGTYTGLWSTTKINESNTYSRSFRNDYGQTFRNFNASDSGLSIRFIKDAPQPPLCTDDVVIYNQTWKRCNLNVTTYRNGDIIPEVQDPAVWATLTTGAWCYYDNDPSTEPIYGKLYNWYAVNDPRGLAPDGYKIPTVNDWAELISLCGYYSGSCLKESGSENWHPFSEGGGNNFLFTGRPGGYRDYTSGSFHLITYEGYWWSAVEKDTDSAWYYSMHYNTSDIYKNSFNKGDALSVRVLKETQQCVNNEVTIGTQTWQCENLNVTTYRNGDIIPQVTDPTEWINLTTGAWCYYNNDPANEAIYGKLYNWYAVNDPRGIGPIGYHVPSETEWNTLKNNLGGIFIAGAKMKSTGTTYWNSPNTGATNSSGFNGLPTGGRGGGSGNFSTSGLYGYWWSSTGVGTQFATICALYHNSTNAGNNAASRRNGNSIRMIKD